MLHDCLIIDRADEWSLRTGTVEAEQNLREKILVQFRRLRTRTPYHPAWPQRSRAKDGLDGGWGGAALTMVAESDDDGLMRQVAAGNETAFRILAARHLPAMLRLARRLLGTVDAEDAAQEALVRIWSNAGQWQPERSRLSTWIHTIVYRLCLDRLRQIRTVALDEAYEAEDESPGAEEQVALASDLRRLGIAMDHLPPRQRAALTLFYYDEMSGSDAAAVMDLSLKAYWSLLHRARQALQAELAPAPSTSRKG